MYTKYVYGLGLICQYDTILRVYHFDYRGSTAAVTTSRAITTDTFTYDTYGKLISRTGTLDIPFTYNGRDGVITDDNGLYYMRARYYHPEIKRFINADIVAGKLSDAITLNRFAYANGNPVSNIDPFGLEAARNNFDTKNTNNPVYDLLKSLGINLSSEIIDRSFLEEPIELLFGGIKIDLTASTYFETDTGAIDFLFSKDGLKEIGNEVVLFNENDFSVSTGAYTSISDSAIGYYFSIANDDWEYTYRHQQGIETEKISFDVTYNSQVEQLPSVNLSLSIEVSQLAKLAVAAAITAAVAAPYVIPEMLSVISTSIGSAAASALPVITAAATTVANTINQLQA